jgi:hypothetical protein
VTAGELRVPVQQAFRLAEFGAAIKSFSAGAGGKIVLTIE